MIKLHAVKLNNFDAVGITLTQIFKNIYINSTFKIRTQDISKRF